MDNQIEIVHLLDLLSRYSANHMPTSYRKLEHGLDYLETTERTETLSLRTDDAEIRLRNRQVSSSSENGSKSWSDEDSTEVEFYLGGQLRMRARRSLGGHSGEMHYTDELSNVSERQIPQTGWQIEEVDQGYLPEFRQRFPELQE